VRSGWVPWLTRRGGSPTCRIRHALVAVCDHSFIIVSVFFFGVFLNESFQYSRTVAPLARRHDNLAPLRRGFFMPAGLRQSASATGQAIERIKKRAPPRASAVQKKAPALQARALNGPHRGWGDRGEVVRTKIVSP
jgi:hypothetical protein